MKNMIGNTPLLEIKYSYKGENRILYAKAEFYNLTGSIKAITDRKQVKFGSPLWSFDSKSIYFTFSEP